MKKRILSMLLAILMVVGLLPNVGLTALAAEPTSTTEVKYGASAASLTEGTLAEAIAANAAYIQLLEDIASTSALEFNNSVTIDLNGKTLTVVGENLGVYVGGDLTLTDSSTAKNGILSGESTTGYGVYVDSSITVEFGSLTGESANGHGVYAKTSITVSDGSLSGISSSENANAGVFTSGNITVTGGTLTGTCNYFGVYANGSINVSGGSLSKGFFG